MTTHEPERPDETDGILTDWSNEVRAALGIEADVDIRSVLGLAGVVAHSVIRPAAPLTTYLVGFAAGRAAALGDDVERIRNLALGIRFDVGETGASIQRVSRRHEARAVEPGP